MEEERGRHERKGERGRMRERRILMVEDIGR